MLAAAAVSLTVRTAGLLLEGVGPSDRPELFAFIVFLGYLTFVTFVIVRHGMKVLKHKGEPAALRTTLGVGLAYGAVAASVGIILYALLLSPPNKILLFALSPIGIGNGIGQLRYMKSEALSRRAWLYEHLGALLGIYAAMNQYKLGDTLATIFAFMGIADSAFSVSIAFLGASDSRELALASC